ncbi:MAG TPA: neutral/alkaline non-lysosomal ceramidase N-terminal domain-containing protein [Terrimicrobiaceae bacterium]|nr:neutral/alkaline non-lysosomal ceramidase N-terminal domain-containing protein [Terrimicrobiaceae bacterium]
MKTVYRAGFGSHDITSSEPILLAGYGADRRQASVSCPIYVKVFVVEDAAGNRAGIVTLDLCGIDAETVALIEEAGRKEGIAPERLTINSSHNHSAPNFDSTLSLYYDPSPLDAERIRKYTAETRGKIREALREAVSDLEEAELSYGMSLAGFGVNRRRDSNRGFVCKALAQVVDHDVPVLAVRRSNGRLRGVLFGYACHTTSLCGLDANGDYAGYACRELLHVYPDIVPMFLAGCGADINPLPRYTPSLSEAYGMILAAAVREAVESPLRTLSGLLKGEARRVALDTLPPPDLNEVVSRLRAHSRWDAAMTQRIISFFERESAKGNPLPSAVPYRVGTLDFGDSLRMVALTGETVVDYALTLKARYGETQTWVLGYCDALTPYIPSRRVLNEGGYEGCESMPEYGYPMPFTAEVEETILAAVKDCVGR